jgi:hypothetical protein
VLALYRLLKGVEPEPRCADGDPGGADGNPHLLPSASLCLGRVSFPASWASG